MPDPIPCAYYPYDPADELCLTVRLNENAPRLQSFPYAQGVVVCTGETTGVVLSWPALVQHLKVLLASSPVAVRDVMEMFQGKAPDYLPPGWTVFGADDPERVKRGDVYYFKDDPNWPDRLCVPATPAGLRCAWMLDSWQPSEYKP